MTRMPKVHEIVKSIFKKDPSRGVNPVSYWKFFLLLEDF